MRKCCGFLFTFLILTVGLFSQNPSSFDRYFIDKTMRIDYFHVGNAQEERVTLDQIYEQGVWAGSLKNLIDDFDNGRYYAKIYDLDSGEMIFSKGFDSYFGEYKTTSAALKGIHKTFHETVLIPYPRNRIRFELEVRNKQNQLESLFSDIIDPAGVDIIREILNKKDKVYQVHISGPPHEKVDLAIIAEGYIQKDEDKLRSDLERFAGIFFSQEPYQSSQSRFNVYGVFRASEQSGCDEPRRGVFKNTAISASFNALGSERYLLTQDNRALRDVAAHVPYDAVVIMVNHKRYGGGGIYNLFCTFTTDNQWSRYLFLHEFGHSFAGLADEYYTSTVAYNEFYPRGVEPTEPNITALLHPDNLKWKKYLSPGIHIPTPWEKEEFDQMDREYQKIRRRINHKIAKMEKTGSVQEKIKKAEQESARLSREHAEKIDAYLANSKYRGKVGVFEGAGYSAEGLYRPMLDCIMFTKGDKPYCTVCEKSIVRIISHYTGLK